MSWVLAASDWKVENRGVTLGKVFLQAFNGLFLPIDGLVSGSEILLVIGDPALGDTHSILNVFGSIKTGTWDLKIGSCLRIQTWAASDWLAKFDFRKRV